MANMHKIWFKKWGWIYRPVSWQGILVNLFVLAFCLNVFLAIDQNSHSVSDTLYGIFPFFIPAFGIYLWVASKRS